MKQDKIKDIQSLCINLDASIRSALAHMDRLKRKLLIVIKDNKFFSLLSIGDIQRAILSKVDLSEMVASIVRNDIKVASEDDDLNAVKEHMRQARNEFMPVISSDNEIKDVIFWEELFGGAKKSELLPENIPLVIMAGGKGSRLAPLTNVFPKPLIPINDKSIIEHIMDQFAASGCDKFYVSVNYKADLIKEYLEKANNDHYQIEFFQEDKPLGTAGSLFLLKGKINSPFFVSNCDIIINQDLSDIYKYHKYECNDITLVSALKHISIPYGTLETGSHGQLQKLSEKPELTYQINTGVYLLEPKVLDVLQDNVFLHITDLIKSVKKKGGRVGVFPVSDGSWSDIGDWYGYLRAIGR